MDVRWAVAIDAFWTSTKQLADRVWPTVLMLAVLLAVWAISRWVARYRQQREIDRCLPQVVGDELRTRDTKIRALELENRQLRRDLQVERTRLRSVAMLLARAGQAVYSEADPLVVRRQA